MTTKPKILYLRSLTVKIQFIVYLKIIYSCQKGFYTFFVKRKGSHHISLKEKEYRGDRHLQYLENLK